MKNLPVKKKKMGYWELDQTIQNSFDGFFGRDESIFLKSFVSISMQFKVLPFAIKICLVEIFTRATTGSYLVVKFSQWL